ncbi:MAG TPA: response regulator transcription factor [Symbiobacteriaceae bacterium]
MSNEAIRLLIVYEYALIREGLRALLVCPDFEIVAEVSNTKAAVEEAKRVRPHVVITDAYINKVSTAEMTRAIVNELPDTKVLILTPHTDAKTVNQCLQAGVQGYVYLDVTSTDLARYIRAVARGEAVLDSKITGIVLARVRGEAIEDRPEHRLTPQQMEILRLLAKGASNREIAQALHLSENTIKGYAAEVLHRLGVKNRVEAAMLATSKGWV